MTRAVIYARFSTELQNEKSTEDQIALCRAYANRQKIDVIATFEDRARSGASVFGRDGLMQLMDAARQRLFDVVIVEALDRLSRASFVRTPSVRLLRLWHVGARP
jgi:site-specific DNA recombinase